MRERKVKKRRDENWLKVVEREERSNFLYASHCKSKMVEKKKGRMYGKEQQKNAFERISNF